jgi:hypothetical protein
MDKETKEIVASNLTLAFYTNAERRVGYLGVERRTAEQLAEGQRDYRQGSVTPNEVYETYERILRMLE